MRIEFTGSLAEVRAEMREFLGYGDVAVVATGIDMVKAAALAAGQPEPAEQPQPAPVLEALVRETSDRAPKRGPGRPRKTEQTAAPAATETSVKAESSPAPAVPQQAPVVAPAAQGFVPAGTYEQAQGAIATLVGTKGVPIALALLQRFGASRLKDVAPERLAEVVERANAAAAGTYDPTAA